jgi:hypothetical protein
MKSLLAQSRVIPGVEHDPWPYINYILYILKAAYREFEERVRQTTSPKGSKAEMVVAAIRKQLQNFA